MRIISLSISMDCLVDCSPLDNFRGLDNVGAG